MFDPKPFVAGLPGLPGVYRMLGAAGEVLYVDSAFGRLRAGLASAAKNVFNERVALHS